jgi:ferric-dicitrate binding protein FerR (iron transport regulator)
MSEPTINRPADDSGPKRDAVGELIRAVGRRSPPPRAHYEEVRAATYAVWRRKVRGRRAKRRVYALAASVLVAVAIGFAFQELKPGERAPAATAELIRGDVAVFSADTGNWQPLGTGTVSPLIGDRLRTSDAGRAALRLDNGAALRIASSTEIAFIDRETLDLSAGTIYVDSGDDRMDSNIEIRTAFGAARDIGTQFEIRAAPTSLRLRVRTGTVELLRDGSRTDTTSAGEQLEISATGAARSVFPADDGAWSWAESLAVPANGRNRTLLAHLRWIARETGKELRFDSLSTEIWVGGESLNDDPSGFAPRELLEILRTTADISYEFSADGAIVISRR